MPADTRTLTSPTPENRTWTSRVVDAGQRGAVPGTRRLPPSHAWDGRAIRPGCRHYGVPIGVSEPQFPLVVTMMTGAWMASGNRVEVTLNGDGTYARLWDDLRSAQQSITLQLYYGAPGRMADALEQILLGRVKAGVRVFVLYDAFGTIDIPAEHRNTLRAGGILVEPFPPICLSTLHLARVRHRRQVVR